VATRRCLNRKCGSWRNRRACWLVDRIPMCEQCFTKFTESHFLDMHSVHRISENEDDFHTTSQSSAAHAPNNPIVV
jgi:hypothetical protein